METCKGKFCPRIRKTCIEHKCAFYMQVQGMHPQTGEAISTYDCTDRLQVLVTLNLGKQSNDLAGSVDSLRNEVSAGASTILLKAIGFRPAANPQIEEKPNARLGDSSGK